MFPKATRGYVVCSACLESNAPEDERCHICDTRLESNLSEDDLFGIYGHNSDDDPLGVFVANQKMGTDTQLKLTAHMCIMCDSEGSQCECDISSYVSFDEALTMTFAENIDVYDPQGACDTCIFSFTPDCVPLREWLRDYMINPTDIEDTKLTGCEQHRSY